MNQQKQYYCYAIDKDGLLTNVHNAVKGREYFCPYCNSPMIPRQGAIRKWHFAHKPDSLIPCSYESYLHKLAKLKIKSWFDESKEFTITFRQKTMCSVLDCPINLSKKCFWHEYNTYDIKKYYDTCTLEKGVNGFIADLLLTDSSHSNRPPILIEICVSHKSTVEKINSGLRIIEISIKSEKDITSLIKDNEISEARDGSAVFYNFNIRRSIPSPNFQQNKFHFWIDKHNKANRYNLYQNYCLSPLPIFLEESIFRIDACFPIDFRFAFEQLANINPNLYRSLNLNLERCYMCKFYRYIANGDTYLCILEKYGKPSINSEMSITKACSFFSFKKFEDITTYCEGSGFRIHKKN